MPLPAMLLRQDWILRLHHTGTGIPYGIALAARRPPDLPGNALDAGDPSLVNDSNQILQINYKLTDR